MRDLLRLVTLMAVTGLALPVAAQETAPAQTDETPAAEAPATPAQQATPEAQPPQPYVKETFQDWRLVCVALAENRESCTMQQLMRDAEGNPVSQVSLAPLPPAAAPRAAAVEIATPLETLLSEDLLIRVDTSEAKRYRFSYCTPQACVARFALTEAEVGAYKSGGKATVTIVPLLAPDQTASVTMSLAGFTAAYEAVTKILAQ
ncbi:invasion protein IalB [Rhodovulum bhavnagarense]|uniref:Invasion protein IalB n=1 Tax=Rhodovulum bhavnagarense TaxID=992286 RepID=A0A4R2RNE4_9RHOB|nr:invasion associated locus B family protein [Rhodovulum bhavnagarense]TCP61311.1 invasion protein IalB [Rhodovulum bhavnagarense]